MSYLKRSPTLIIFFLLLFVIIVFAATAVLYQKALTKLNDKIIDRDNKISVLTKTLSQLNSNLSVLNEKFELQLLREQNLSNLYTELKDNKEKLEIEKISLLKKINQTEKELFNVKFELNKLNNDFETLKTQYSNLNRTYYNVLEDIKDVCKKASSLNISECRNYR
ncbi:MAG: hypothetical protein QXE31_04785 [Candidatus Woesearchaeota archaeon]